MNYIEKVALRNALADLGQKLYELRVEISAEFDNLPTPSTIPESIKTKLAEVDALIAMGKEYVS